MSKRELEEFLEKGIGRKFTLLINDNRSTMLSIRRGPDRTSVSLHRMFLRAPQNVMNALACYIRGSASKIAPSIKAFIDENVSKLDYSNRIDLSALEAQGEAFDLKLLYDRVNERYFRGELALAVTWYGAKEKRYRSTANLGLYHHLLKLIKVHRVLDSMETPEYVVSFVLYHEMLHSICSSAVGKRGRRKIHTKEFREKERLFHLYREAADWIHKNRERFFI